MKGAVSCGSDSLTLVINREIVRLLYDEILFFQIIDHCISITARDKAYYTHSVSLSEIEKNLDDERFFKTHRSYIVNIDYIKTFSNDYITLRGYDSYIPVSRSRRNSLRQRLVSP